jgi:hypothetical protein
MRPEALEVRMLPAAVSVVATVDGYARDANRDEVFTVLDTAGSNLLVRNSTGINTGFERGLLEFDFTTISTALSVNSATLVLNVSQLTRDGLKFPKLNVVGYTGNGVLELADGSVAGTLLGTTTVNARGELRINLDTAFIRAQGGGFLGLRLENPDPNSPFAIYSSLESGFGNPTLELDLTLDIPTKVFNVDEQRPNGTIVGDAGIGNNINYSFLPGPGTTVFNIHPTTGIITVADSSQLLFSIEDQYVMTVQATLPDSSVGTYQVTINVKNVFGANNEPVVEASQFTIEEFSAVGTFVGKVNAVDPDAADPLTFSISNGIADSDSGNTNNAFKIDPKTGVITVNNQTALSLKNQTSFVITIRVEDTQIPRKVVYQNMKIFLTPRAVAVPNGNRVQLQPSVDAELRDLNNDGVFESMNTTANLIRVENAAVERRGVLEFDLSGISSNKIVKSAFLTIHINAHNGNSFPLDIFGYAGDGVATGFDAVAGSLIGSRAFSFAGSVDNRSYTIELSPALIQQLLGTSNDLGLVLRTNHATNAIQFDSTEGPGNLGNALARRPSLNLVLEDAADDVLFNDPTTLGITAARSTGSAFTTFAAGALRQGVTFSELLTGDFNGDGRLDIAGRNSANGEVLVALATANQFVTGASWTTFSTVTTFKDMVVGDFNGDGRDDIAGRSAQGQLLVALSTGTKFNNVVFDTLPTALRSLSNVKVGDFNGDGRDDLMGIVTTTGEVVVSISNGSTSFASSVWGTVPLATTREIHVGDFNGDGRDDVFTIQTTPQGVGNLVVLRSTGTSFASTLFGTLAPNVPYVGFRLGDFNGDGLDDIVAFRANGSSTIYRSTGGAFVQVFGGILPVPPGSVSASDIVIGDFNRDGKSDILIRQSQSLFVAQGTAAGLFSSSLFGTINSVGQLNLLGVGNY